MASKSHLSESKHLINFINTSLQSRAGRVISVVVKSSKEGKVKVDEKI